ncbi:glucosyl-3-phosphoglycerate synthase [Nonomuraea spiralis]|uniref:Glucosyl-3-phosphoglycerate synthase n=1 Tax=Nonomuraea spiralis TaxID=46182 RepID=A0ABV5IJG7_9ACTN|nr:glucosyl-3-phosphoglycerate synthase [Nonomuraea spiralis]
METDPRALARVREWHGPHSSTAAEWPVDALIAAKGNTTVSVVLPARDEERTVGDIVTVIRRELVERAPLVDEIVVVDSDSTDATAERARAAGARVVAQNEVLPHLPRMTGKGEALWKGLAASHGDLVVYVDADLLDFGAHFVSGLVGPLLVNPGTQFVKATYERPYTGEDGVPRRGAGGRVTELVARPLLNMFWPELAGFGQPLGGEYAARRDVLARMAGQIMHTAWSRLERQGRVVSSESPARTLLQFGLDGRAGLVDVAVAERPPLASLVLEEDVV